MFSKILLIFEGLKAISKMVSEIIAFFKGAKRKEAQKKANDRKEERKKLLKQMEGASDEELKELHRKLHAID